MPRSGGVVVRRPDRQGHPHGAARRADLAVAGARRTSAARSACTARWTPPARCSARWSRSACSRWPARLRRRLRRSASASRSIGLGGARLLRPAPKPARAGARAEPAPAVSSERLAARCCGARAALPHARDRRRGARPGRRSATASSTSACSARRLRRRRSSRCCTSAPPARTWSWPCRSGVLADRVGRGRSSSSATSLLIVVYAALLLAGRRRPSRCIGASAAVRRLLRGDRRRADGDRRAPLLPEHLRGSGLALLVTATSLARLVGSMMFGALWTSRACETAAPRLRGAARASPPRRRAPLSRGPARGRCVSRARCSSSPLRRGLRRRRRGVRRARRLGRRRAVATLTDAQPAAAPASTALPAGLGSSCGTRRLELRPARARVYVVDPARPGRRTRAPGRVHARPRLRRPRPLPIERGRPASTSRVSILDTQPEPRRERPRPRRARAAPACRRTGATAPSRRSSPATPTRRRATFSTRTHAGRHARPARWSRDLERFAGDARRRELERRDHNFWGVTFAPDGDRFYATLGTGEQTYLVRGDVRRGPRVTVLRENVECPSLSPDGTRIAFKKRVGGRGMWRLHVLDLATLRETPLAEHALDRRPGRVARRPARALRRRPRRLDGARRRRRRAASASSAGRTRRPPSAVCTEPLRYPSRRPWPSRSRSSRTRARTSAARPTRSPRPRSTRARSAASRGARTGSARTAASTPVARSCTCTTTTTTTTPRPARPWPPSS